MKSTRAWFGEDVGRIVGRRHAAHHDEALGLVFAHLEAATSDVLGALRDLVLLGELLGTGVVDVERRRVELCEAQVAEDLVRVRISVAASEAAIISASVEESAMQCWRLLA